MKKAALALTLFLTACSTAPEGKLTFALADAAAGRPRSASSCSCFSRAEPKRGI